jgi:hypothetical protein
VLDLPDGSQPEMKNGYKTPWADEPWLMVPHPQGILFRSGATIHYPGIAREIWTGLPPAPGDGEGKLSDEAAVDVTGDEEVIATHQW